MQYYLKSKEEALAEVQTTVEGLTTSEAEARLAANGKNNIESVFLRMKKDFHKGDVFILFFDIQLTIVLKKCFCHTPIYYPCYM